jgi:hypothetical protein
MHEVILGSYMSGQVEEGKHGRKEHDGKKQVIERSHFDDPICNNFQYYNICS